MALQTSAVSSMLSAGCRAAHTAALRIVSPRSSAWPIAVVASFGKPLVSSFVTAIFSAHRASRRTSSTATSSGVQCSAARASPRNTGSTALDNEIFYRLAVGHQPLTQRSYLCHDG